MENNNKKGNGLIIILIILLVVLIGLVVFNIYNDINKKDNTERNNDIEVIKLTKDSQIVQYLNQVFVYTKDGLLYGDTEKIISNLIYGTEEEKLYEKLRIAYRTAVHENDKITRYQCNKLEKKKFEDEYNYVACAENIYHLFYEYEYKGKSKQDLETYFNSKEFDDKLETKETILIKKDEFDKVMKRLFGENIRYNYEDLDYWTTFNNGLRTMAIFNEKVDGYVMYNGYRDIHDEVDLANEIALSDIRQDENKLSLIYKEIEIYNTKLKEYKTITLVLNFKLDKNGNYVFIDAEEEK